MTTNNPEWAHLKEVKERVLKRLSKPNAVHEVHFVPITEQRLEIYVFFDRDEDVHVSERTGFTQQIKDCFNEELEQVGRGASAGMNARFEFDSHENVLKNFQGNYFLRLR